MNLGMPSRCRFVSLLFSVNFHLAMYQNPSYFMSHAHCELILLIYITVYHNFWQTAEPEPEPEPFENETP